MSILRTERGKNKRYAIINKSSSQIHNFSL